MAPAAGQDPTHAAIHGDTTMVEARQASQVAIPLRATLDRMGEGRGR